jgi:hypothetical protein
LAFILALAAAPAVAADCPSGFAPGPDGICRPAADDHGPAAGSPAPAMAPAAPSIGGTTLDSLPVPYETYGHGWAAHGWRPEPASPSSSPTAPAAELWPARAYLRGADIPPRGVGAYGVVSLRGRATPAERGRLIMLCKAYEAYLPLQATLPASIAPGDQMLTVWPLDDPEAPQAKADSCDYAVDHYDLVAGDAAIRDARRQHQKLAGRGPFLIGWSPSNTRGRPDKLVLVVDMSRFTSQDSFDTALQFWKTEVVENPTLWRSGFSRQSLKLAIRDFFDTYGQELLSVVKLSGGG